MRRNLHQEQRFYAGFSPLIFDGKSELAAKLFILFFDCIEIQDSTAYSNIRIKMRSRSPERNF